jgi:hypothetical protein
MIKPQSLTALYLFSTLPSCPFTGDDQPVEMLSFHCNVMQGMGITGRRQELSGSVHHLPPDTR